MRTQRRVSLNVGTEAVEEDSSEEEDSSDEEGGEEGEEDSSDEEGGEEEEEEECDSDDDSDDDCEEEEESTSEVDSDDSDVIDVKVDILGTADVRGLTVRMDSAYESIAKRLRKEYTIVPKLVYEDKGTVLASIRLPSLD